MVNKRGGLFVLFVIITSIFLVSKTYADDSTSFSVDVADATLELTVPQTVSIDLAPTFSNAAFGSANITVKIATNNMNGYTLTMSVPRTDLVHTSISSSVIPTISSSANEANFPTNAWGYKIVGDEYLPVLLDNAPDAWVTAGPTNGTNHIMTLASKVDTTKTAGTYENVLVFKLVTNPNSFKNTITFDGNGSDGGSMEPQQVYQGEPTVLDANSYTKSGYVFNGWNTKADGLGIAYGDKQAYTAPYGTASASMTLYAQWLDENSPSAGYAGKTLQDAFELAYVQNPGSFPKDGGGTKHGLYVPDYQGGYFEATSQSDYEGIPANDLRFAIQDIDLPISVNGTTISICDYTTAIGSEAYVLDLRDFKSYWITKMKDGSCWMTQNLDYDLPTSTPLNSLTSDLNVSGSGVYSSGYSTDANNVIYWQPERGTSTDKSTFSCSLYTGYFHPYSIDLGDKYETYNNNAKCDYSENNCSNYPNSPNSTNKEHGHIGNNYNLNAVVATNDSSSIGSSRLMENSICPQGWRMPIRDTSGTLGNDDFVSLASAYNFYGLASAGSGVLEPTYFVHTGYLSWSTLQFSISGPGVVSGDYWSGILRPGNAQGTYIIIQNNFISAGDSTAYRANGKSVRCVAR